MFLKALVCAGPKPVKTLRRPCHSDDRHIQVAVPDHSLKCREDLLERQITSGAEENKCIRIQVRHCMTPVARSSSGEAKSLRKAKTRPPGANPDVNIVAPPPTKNLSKHPEAQLVNFERP